MSYSRKLLALCVVRGSLCFECTAFHSIASQADQSSEAAAEHISSWSLLDSCATDAGVLH